MPSLLQLIQSVLPDGSKVISGEISLYNEVNGALAISAALPIPDGQKGNDFALIETGNDAGAGMDLIMALIEKGVSGIGIRGAIAAQALCEAQARKTPVIQMPPGTDMKSLETAITQYVAEERQSLYPKERELNCALMDLALAGRGRLEILQKLRQMTGRNLGFIDLNYHPHFSLDQRLVDGFKKHVHQAIAKLRYESATVSTPVVGLILIPRHACFLGLIRVGREIQGYLMLEVSEDSISEVDRLAVRAGTMALAVEMSRRRAVEETEARFAADIVEDLLTGDSSAENDAEIARRLDINLQQPYVCLLIQPAAPLDEPNITIRNIAGLWPQAECYYRSDQIIILYPPDSSKTVVELRKLGKSMFAEMVPFLSSAITLGIGRSYKGAGGLRNSFREAEQSLAMGLQLFGPGSITCFADLGIYRLLFSLKQTGELAAYHQEYLGALSEYDRKHDGELIYTLKAFLHHSALADTARAIHVHRNTLLYRLSRIQEITGADLEDGGTRLTLHVAILAGEVLSLT